MKTRLTQLVVNRMQAPASGRVDVYDTTMPAFGLRFSAGGHKTWFVITRLHGKQRRYSFSFEAYPKVDSARERGRELMRAVDRGEDPAEDRRRKQAKSDTVAHLAEKFIERQKTRVSKNYEQQIRYTLRKYVTPPWGKRDIASITRRDVRELLDYAETTLGLKAGANMLLYILRAWFTWLVDQEIVEVSPCTGVKDPVKTQSRERVLEDNELVILWRACETLAAQPTALGKLTAAHTQLLLLTGQRRGEVAGMRWQDIDFDERVWLQRTNKAQRDHQVPLSLLTIKIIQSQPRLGPYVLSFDGGQHPINCFNRMRDALSWHVSGTAGGKTGRKGRKPVIDVEAVRRLSGEGLNGNEIAKRLRISHFSAYRFLAANANKWEEPPPIVDAPIENWCIHDLRRSFATGLAKLGVATSTIAQLLNHREGGITKIYNRYSYLEKQEERHGPLGPAHREPYQSTGGQRSGDSEEHMSENVLVDAGDPLLTSTRVRELVGNVSAVCIWRWQRDPRVQFPMPDAMINDRCYWKSSTIRAWCERQFALTSQSFAASLPHRVALMRTAAPQ